MTRRRQFNERKLLKVYLDEADYQRIAESAKEAGISVSEWVRERCGQTSFPRPQKVSRIRAAVPRAVEDAPSDVPDIAVPDAACPHKKRRGELCYKCDPKFGLPSIP